MTTSKMMTANELAEIMASELRSLASTEMTDRNIGRKIDKAKQIFNGSGKLIALASLSIEAQRMGVKTEILNFPEQPTKLLAGKK